MPNEWEVGRALKATRMFRRKQNSLALPGIASRFAKSLY
jgi:hypothetical protein